jgi:hypothetical protein
VKFLMAADSAEMGALAAERRSEEGGGSGAVEAWRRRVAETLDGPADRGAGAGAVGGSYGALAQRSFPPPPPSDNLQVPQWDGEDGEAEAPQVKRGRAPSSEGDDEWAQVREEYGKKPPGGPLGWAKRMPSHVLVMLTVVLVVGAVLCAVVFMHPGRSAHAAAKKASTQTLAKQEAPKSAAAASKEAAVPPLTGAQKKEVEKLATKQAQQMASAAMAAAQQAEEQKEEQQEAAQRQAAEEAKEQKRAALKQLLTPQPTDSPEVRVQIHRALRQQRTLAFDKQRVQVAENNSGFRV